MQLDRIANPDESRESPLASFVPIRPGLVPGAPLPAPQGCESVSVDLATWCRVLPQPGHLRAVEHGLTVTFHPNGRRASETHFVQGKRHGVERFWTDGGELMSLCEWRNDARVHELVFRYTLPQLAPADAEASLEIVRQVGRLQTEHAALAQAGRFAEADALMARIEELLASTTVPR